VPVKSPKDIHAGSAPIMKETWGKFFVQNFGCGLRRADGAAIEALLAAKRPGSGRGARGRGPGRA